MKTSARPEIKYRKLTLPEGLTDQELVDLWKGAASIEAICKRWGCEEHVIYISWSMLKARGLLPQRRRGSAANGQKGSSPKHPRASDPAPPDDPSIPDAEPWAGARIVGTDRLLERLFAVHKQPRADLPAKRKPGHAATS